MKAYSALLVASAFSVAAHAAETPLAPAMVTVPTGKVDTHTCPAGQTSCEMDDYVRRSVTIDAFQLGVMEVTFDEWDRCVRDGGCVSPASDWAYQNRPLHPPCVPGEACQFPHDETWGRGNRPVINVSWDDVQQYIAWLNKNTGASYRLPTSDEWDYAARGGARTKYPWGKSLGKNQANCDGCGSRWDKRQTAPVGSFKPNAYGLHDMAGNVSEWVSTCSTPAKSGSQECTRVIYRGGAWSYAAKSMDIGNLMDHFPTLRASYLGFRLARSK